ncbi:MAG: hypothetical protein ACLR7U_02300 [Ruthenibacterium lactatiformans]
MGYNRVFGYYIEVSRSFRTRCLQFCPQADAGQRGAVHHRGSEGTGEQDPGRKRASGCPGTPAL